MKINPICHLCGEPIDALQVESVKPKRSRTLYYHKACADLIYKEYQNLEKEKSLLQIQKPS
jgi:hypothetical protein